MSLLAFFLHFLKHFPMSLFPSANEIFIVLKKIQKTKKNNNMKLILDGKEARYYYDLLIQTYVTIKITG
jgi:hypothetical protein